MKSIIRCYCSRLAPSGYFHTAFIILVRFSMYTLQKRSKIRYISHDIIDLPQILSLEGHLPASNTNIIELYL